MHASPYRRCENGALLPGGALLLWGREWPAISQQALRRAGKAFVITKVIGELRRGYGARSAPDHQCRADVDGTGAGLAWVPVMLALRLRPCPSLSRLPSASLRADPSQRASDTTPGRKR